MAILWRCAVCVTNQAQPIATLQHYPQKYLNVSLTCCYNASPLYVFRVTHVSHFLICVALRRCLLRPGLWWSPEFSCPSNRPDRWPPATAVRPEDNEDRHDLIQTILCLRSRWCGLASSRSQVDQGQGRLDFGSPWEAAAEKVTWTRFLSSRENMCTLVGGGPNPTETARRRRQPHCDPSPLSPTELQETSKVNEVVKEEAQASGLLDASARRDQALRRLQGGRRGVGGGAGDRVARRSGTDLPDGPATLSAGPCGRRHCLAETSVLTFEQPLPGVSAAGGHHGVAAVAVLFSSGTWHHLQDMLQEPRRSSSSPIQPDPAGAHSTPPDPRVSRSVLSTSLKMDGPFATPSPGPRSPRETP